MTDPCPETLEEVYGPEEPEAPQSVQPEVLSVDHTPIAPGPGKMMEHIAVAQASKFAGISLASLTEPKPEDQNPDALLANGYMRKGHAIFLSAPSGVGKSVISIQLAYAWACNKEVLGIKPVRALRIAIIESEDDEEEMYKFRESMRRGYAKLGWKQADLDMAEGNIRWIREFAAGEDFVKLIENIQTAMYNQGKVDGVTKPFDMFIVNPFLNYIGGDATDNSYLRDILRDKLDPVIKSEGDYKDKPWTKCGIFFVHHFTKPPNQQALPSFGVNDYGAYAALGGSDLTNWQRGSLTIAPIQSKELKPQKDAGFSYFWFAAPKRGKYLYWPKCDLPGAPSAPARVLRQANWQKEDEKGLLFWFDVPDGPAKKPDPDGEKPTVEDDAKLVAAQVKMREYTATDLRKRARGLWKNDRDKNDNARGDAAYECFAADPGRFGCGVRFGANNSKTFYALPD